MRSGQGLPGLTPVRVCGGACEVLQDGARATHFHAIDGSYLGADASEALAQLAQHPELEVR